MERTKNTRNNIRQYSVELGLRTHRPSAITPDFGPIRSSSGNICDSMSTVSISAQYGNYGDSDWWQLPLTINQNYEQKVRPVSISYSSDEIYGKARINIDSHPEKLVSCSANILSCNHKNHQLQTTEQSSKCLLDSIEQNDTVSPRNRPYLFAAPEHRDSKGRKYLENHGDRLSKQGEDTKMFQETISYRSFDEARKAYPNSDTEDTEDERELPALRPSCFEFVDKHDERDSTLTLTINTTVDTLEATKFESISNFQQPYELQSSRNSVVNDIDISQDDENKNQQNSSLSTMYVPPLNLIDSFNGLNQQFIQMELPTPTEVESKMALKTKNDDNPKPVPPIDLSLLSPKKKSKVAAASVSNPVKSANYLSLKPVKENITKQSPDSKTRKIVQEIKRLVQTNPKEIANEIKRRVEVKHCQHLDVFTIPEEKGCDKSSINYVDENNASSRQKSSIPIITDAYNKYVSMTPRIKTGDVSVWSCLPDEIWLMILMYLDPCDKYSFMVTCHHFSQLACDPTLWKIIRLSRKQLSDEELLKIGEMQPVELQILQCTGTKIDGCSVSNHGLMKLFSKSKNSLKRLSLASCVVPPLSGEAMLHHAAVHCVRITDLDVSWCNLSDRDVELIADSFKSLNVLCLNGNQALTDSSITKICFSFFAQLTCLEMQGCFKVTNNILSVLASCSNLRSLNIGQCHKLSSTSMASAISKLKALEILCLKGQKQIKDSCIKSIVRCCQNLKHLVVAQCTGLTSKALTEIACSLAHLEVLDVSSCKECVDGTSIKTVLANCPKLLSLDLSSTAVTSDSIEHILASDNVILDLKLNFCLVTESSIKQLLHAKSHTLRTLQLYGIKGLDKNDLNSLYPSVDIQM